jgi:hypothetical protein
MSVPLADAPIHNCSFFYIDVVVLPREKLIDVLVSVPDKAIAKSHFIEDALLHEPATVGHHQTALVGADVVKLDVGNRRQRTSITNPGFLKSMDGSVQRVNNEVAIVTNVLVRELSVGLLPRRQHSHQMGRQMGSLVLLHLLPLLVFSLKFW